MIESSRRIRVEEFADRVLAIVLDRPPINAADEILLRELREVFEAMHGEDVDAVVLTGAGRAFCGGNDLHEFAAMDADAADRLMHHVRRAFWALYDCPVPVVASVNGAALGTGLALTALCDLVVASERAVFGLPELEVGVLGGVKFARRLVPELAARRMFLTAERIPAAELARMGAPITVVPHDELEPRTRELLSRITDKGTTALRFAKRAMNAVEFMDMKPGYEYEQTFTIRMADRAEAKAAVRAVLEKRSGGRSER